MAEVHVKLMPRETEELGMWAWAGTHDLMVRIDTWDVGIIHDRLVAAIAALRGVDVADVDVVLHLDGKVIDVEKSTQEGGVHVR